MALNQSELGLIFSISADPSKAQEAISALKGSVENAAAGVKAASEPVIVYDRAVQGAAASTRDWEKQADAALAALRAETQARGQAAVATERHAAATRQDSQAALTTEERIAQLRKQYDALAVSAKNLSKTSILGPEAAAGLRLDRELMAEIKTEAAGLGAQLGQERAGGVLRGINESLFSMREFRAIFAATIGLASFGFWITEWARLADWTGKALENMDGIQTAENNIVLGQAAKALKQINDEASQQLLKPHDERIAKVFQESIQLRIKALEQLREEVQGLKDGTLQGEQYAKALQDVAAASRKFGIQGSYASAIEQIDEKIKEFRAASVVEQQSMEKTQKSAHKSAKAHDDLAKAMDAMNRMLATATPHLPPYIAEIDRLRLALQHADSGIANTTDLLRQQIEMAQRGLPTLRQLGFELNPQEAVAGISAAQGPILTAAQQAQGASAPVIRSSKEIQAALRAQQAAYRQTAQIARESFSIMGEAVGQYGGTFGRVFSQVSRVIELMINLHRLESTTAATSASTSVAAANAQAAGQVAATGKVSLVKSVFETAEGIAALARFDFHAAALHFASSAKFLSVLGIAASVAGAFASAGGGGGGGAAAVAAGGAPGRNANQELPPGPLTPRENQQNQQQVFQVIFQGPTYGGKAGMDEIVSHINEALVNRRLKLYATHTITGRRI